MPKRNERTAIVPAKQLDALVRRHVAEALAFQPWFRSRPETAAIRAKQSIPERQKWAAYYRRWGCLYCHRKTREHVCLGFCHACHQRVFRRLRAIVRELAAERPAGPIREKILALDKPIRTARALLLGPEEER
jgi:hypothetical protein